MPRSVEEWKGKTDDSTAPPSVRLRVLRRFNYRCQGNCGGRVIVPGKTWTCDHKIALVNGGENREANLQPLCEFCNPEKNAADLAEKSKTFGMAATGFGLKTAKRPMPGSKASPWKRKMNGRTERRSKEFA